MLVAVVLGCSHRAALETACSSESIGAQQSSLVKGIEPMTCVGVAVVRDTLSDCMDPRLPSVHHSRLRIQKLERRHRRRQALWEGVGSTRRGRDHCSGRVGQIHERTALVLLERCERRVCFGSYLHLIWTISFQSIARLE